MNPHGQLDLLLLATLARVGPVHGYGLIPALREASDGAFDAGQGTVYPTLHRLERGGAVDTLTITVGARRRRLYRVTGAGHALLAARRRQWFAWSAAIDRVVGPVPPDQA